MLVLKVYWMEWTGHWLLYANHRGKQGAADVSGINPLLLWRKVNACEQSNSLLEKIKRGNNLALCNTWSCCSSGSSVPDRGVEQSNVCRETSAAGKRLSRNSYISSPGKRTEAKWQKPNDKTGFSNHFIYYTGYLRHRARHIELNIKTQTHVFNKVNGKTKVAFGIMQLFI